MNRTRVSVWVTSTNPEIVTRAAESLTGSARAAIGLGLEGVDIMLTAPTIGPDDDEAEPGDEP